MSRLTECCFCSLQMIRERASAAGKVVTVRSATKEDWAPLAKEALVHVAGEEPDSDKHFAAWFMELTDACVCSGDLYPWEY